MTPEPRLELAQVRFVSAAIEPIAAFYAALLGVSVPFNDHYLEMPAGPASVGFSRVGFTEDRTSRVVGKADLAAHDGEMILDFTAADVDDEYSRINTLGATWVMMPTTHPWGRRSMLLRDPHGHLINVSTSTTADFRR
ncbi:VOC family protein [Mycobacterium nebraskense]|uniref:VOC family protein n=1 Tax=Mycobacterium nebraskense TaxID=244292 RepID=UPI00069BD844|nr:VOC family protein [Mycobacterium nebraskense]